jgi:Fe-S-cluster containining protein
MCGTCCYGKGGISVDAGEIRDVAHLLGISPESFVAQYCLEKKGRFSIKTGPDNFCIFYHREKRCLIHPAKPRICRLWPYFPAILKDKDNWELAKEACPGINPDCAFEEFIDQSKKNEGPV